MTCTPKGVIFSQRIFLTMRVGHCCSHRNTWARLMSGWRQRERSRVTVTEVKEIGIVGETQAPKANYKPLLCAKLYRQKANGCQGLQARNPGYL